MNRKQRRAAQKKGMKQASATKSINSLGLTSTEFEAVLNQAYMSCEDKDVLREREQNEKNLFSVLEQYPVPADCNGADKNMWALMVREVLALEDRIQRGCEVTKWQNAQFKLMHGLLGFSLRDHLTDEESAEIREAGVLLNKQGGTAEMIQTLTVWVPRSLRRYVEYQWDGIGNWCA